MTRSHHHGAKRQRLLDDESAVEPWEPSQPDSPALFSQDGCEEMVCFGMVSSIDGRCDLQTSAPDTFPVHLSSSDRFLSSDSSKIAGYICSQYGPMIDGLLAEQSLLLHTSCIPESTQNDRSFTAMAQVNCTLEITVYGPCDLFDEIGDWFQEYNIFLQDPRVCHLDVRYCNPQRLSSHTSKNTLTVSQAITQSSAQVHFQELDERPELLDLISGQEDLGEATPSPFLSTSLHKHQKQALTFMLRREEGWKPGDAWPDIWETADSSHARHYINRITKQHQSEPPQQCHGGIIADPMGLGKTLTMIALAANDFAAVTEDRIGWKQSDDLIPVEATLIIVPQPLLSTWEGQLTEHVAADQVRFRRHHGKSRLKSVKDLESINIVLTTYHTLSADWNIHNADSESQIMFSVHWKRIILDEAHLVRNVRTRMSRAIHKLESTCRWAVTGTPIQNNISDLAALLKFIRAYPYDDLKLFDNDISRMWKAGEDEEAVQRLKRLSRCLILRRAKNTIDLPPRRDVKCPVDFSRAERSLYESIRQQAILKIDDALRHDLEISRSGAYVNFLQQIESMRLVCNLGLHYHNRHDNASSRAPTDWAATAQHAFNSHREMNMIVCSQCSSSLEMTESLVDDTLFEDSPLFSRCLKYACAECSHKLRITGFNMACDHNPRCPVAPVSVSTSALEETFSQSNPKDKRADRSSFLGNLPSKVEILVSDLKALPFGVKSIVFSTWRLTLDVVETGLNQAGIQCVRFDGKVPQTQRQPVLNRFKTDPSVRVMLLTLQCGAVGLTLTEASRAYLMEPHWNPTIEDQALARIHRIGQKREVTTIRFYIRDSFEERVMEVQESKKNLAGVLLSGHDGGQADDSLGALQRLRSLL
ncbi:hypothetical protein P280DRAFT_551575 [Massarina eburnea CBS 473.64]|uniref:Uncharacterized protein n=1 Tax=Massarina eburnea CBS 473.64 TaxID=1395130 RepID=A0A6A6RUR9_9PLEO|nr:hypothetical protein P280DRAFT_551575 [Massarina eburnea CBS 473.64]